MTATITAFANSPDRGQGLARDMRVRWALEEVGQSYDVRLLSFEAMKQPPHLALQPFGQIPSWEEGGLALFESGAIVLHIARSHPGLLPDDPAADARTIAWMFAALNTIEPPIVAYSTSGIAERDQPWFAARRPIEAGRVHERLGPLSQWLGQRDWLEDAFTAGDLLMVSVLQRLKPTPLLAGYPNLSAYVARAEARPAFQRAFAAQRAVFEASEAAAEATVT